MLAPDGVDASLIRGTPPEREFLVRWYSLTKTRLEREYKFHGERRWRFDCALPDIKVAIEIDGGIWRGTKGAHGGGGAIRDREKDFEAVMLGWTVIRLSPQQAREWLCVRRLVGFVADRTRERKNQHAEEVIRTQTQD